jgi:hypothetical protein
MLFYMIEKLHQGKIEQFKRGTYEQIHWLSLFDLQN